MTLSNSMKKTNTLAKPLTAPSGDVILSVSARVIELVRTCQTNRDPTRVARIRFRRRRNPAKGTVGFIPGQTPGHTWHPDSVRYFDTPEQAGLTFK